VDYTEFSREQLLDRIKNLEMLTQELLNEKEQETRLEYAWTGNLGHWYWNIKTKEELIDSGWAKISYRRYEKLYCQQGGINREN